MFKEIHHLKRVNKNTTGQTEIVLQSMRRILRPTCIYQERETKKKKKNRGSKEKIGPQNQGSDIFACLTELHVSCIGLKTTQLSRRKPVSKPEIRLCQWAYWIHSNRHKQASFSLVVDSEELD